MISCDIISSVLQNFGAGATFICFINLSHHYTIDNRGGRRDWKHVHTYMADACHGHMTISKVRKSHNFAIPQRLRLLPLRKYFVHCSRVAQGPEAKEERIRQFSE